MRVSSEMMVAVMAALLEMAEVIFVAARAGAAAGTAAMAGTAAGTEHVGDSRSSRYLASSTVTASRGHHLDRTHRRHTRTHWCS